ncbi:MAG TPA: prenyltransferase/squalene oxidase repeat-containing protein [Bryobacteraceae bacterium]|nr:prenyltransferase/squalene oxidase repeat-containing protein [Bryobacteraceae bacterium]
MSVAEDLLSRQNADGGWSYAGGGSWTEPTCYALLGLAAAGVAAPAEIARGAAWLARCQRPDGGFAPRESVPESTWLAALVLLLPEDLQGRFDAEKAARWVAAQSGRESGWVYRLRLMLAGGRSEDSLAFDGWPWYPGAAAWTAPTALSILALEKMNRGRRDAALEARIERGREFLLARHCRDDGWNHGSTRALGYDSDSYPETTGLALVALHASQAPQVARGIARAETLLDRCQSSEAAYWLSLGLSAHGRAPKMPQLASHGTTMELAIAALAGAALKGRNLFLAA